jgi:magnesium transporter
LLLESVLDNYFKVLEKMELEIENFNISDISKDPSPEILLSVERYRKYLHTVKKSIIPVRDFASSADGVAKEFVKKEHLKYYAEIKDMAMSLIDSCERLEMSLEREINLFFSVQGHRMNQVMKTLTIVATVFIPLTFIAGIYGMNFDNIPELHWQYGYWGVWIISVLTAVAMMYYFKKKRWL